jgi:hypothetical protein
MKSTEIFKRTVRNYLEQSAAADELFAVSYAKPDKNIDECITYILNTVKKSGCNGFDDSEIYSMAIHYYMEDGIDAGNPPDCKVAVNHTIELTAEEKEEARKAAVQRFQDEMYRQMKQQGRKPAAKTVTNHQPNLFDSL